MESPEDIDLERGFFAGLDPATAALVAGCARRHRFEPDAYLFREGDEAREFFLLREGDVTLEIFTPSGPTVVLGTNHAGDIAGASWLVPPYRWTSDARARTAVQAIGFDAVALREACEADPRTGYTMMKRFAPLLVRRLNNAYLQLLDLYSRPGAV